MDITIRNRGYLPHWEAESATYFVTFRLADALPRGALLKIAFDRKDIPGTAARMGRSLSPGEQRRLSEVLAERIEKYLDAGAGACLLKNDAVAGVVANALREFDGSRYDSLAWCIMPNHVHVVFTPIGENTLPKIVHSWKSYSAKESNRFLGRSGEFWQREYYDHLVRDSADFYRVVRYVMENPRRAGLSHWCWVCPRTGTD